jgi:hypothetical protein
MLSPRRLWLYGLGAAEPCTVVGAGTMCDAAVKPVPGRPANPRLHPEGSAAPCLRLAPTDSDPAHTCSTYGCGSGRPIPRHYRSCSARDSGWPRPGSCLRLGIAQAGFVGIGPARVPLVAPGINTSSVPPAARHASLSTQVGLSAAWPMSLPSRAWGRVGAGRHTFRRGECSLPGAGRP